MLLIHQLGKENIIENMSNANVLTGSIINYIRMNHSHAERVNNIARQITTRSGAKVFIPSANFKGTADIHACKLRGDSDDWAKIGQFVAIEVKIGRDKQSEDQKLYQGSVERAGGVYLIVKNFDDFERQWNEI